MLLKYQYQVSSSFLYVSGEDAAKQQGLVASKGITHIINCAGPQCPNYLEYVRALSACLPAAVTRFLPSLHLFFAFGRHVLADHTFFRGVVSCRVKKLYRCKTRFLGQVDASRILFVERKP